MIDQSAIQSLVENFCNTTLRAEELDSDLMDLGVLDSLKALDLLGIIEEKYKVKFSFGDYTMIGFFSIKKITESVNKNSV